jgi:hypothetical protein
MNMTWKFTSFSYLTITIGCDHISKAHAKIVLQHDNKIASSGVLHSLSHEGTSHIFFYWVIFIMIIGKKNR